MVIALERFQTARMRAEPIGPEHRAGLLALLADPRVGATLGGAAAGAQVDAFIARMQRAWAQDGFGLHAFLDSGTGRLVARGGLHRMHVAGRDEVELGWAVVPDRWGQGLATELGAAGLALAAGPLACTEVVSCALPGNHASLRVMEKLGFAFDCETRHAGLRHVLYRKRLATMSTARSRE